MGAAKSGRVEEHSTELGSETAHISGGETHRSAVVLLYISSRQVYIDWLAPFIETATAPGPPVVGGSGMTAVGNRMRNKNQNNQCVFSFFLFCCLTPASSAGEVIRDSACNGLVVVLGNNHIDGAFWTSPGALSVKM